MWLGRAKVGAKNGVIFTKTGHGASDTNGREQAARGYQER